MWGEANILETKPVLRQPRWPHKKQDKSTERYKNGGGGGLPFGEKTVESGMSDGNQELQTIWSFKKYITEVGYVKDQNFKEKRIFMEGGGEVRYWLQPRKGGMVRRGVWVRA